MEASIMDKNKSYKSLFIIIAVVIILLAIYFGINRSLGGKMNKASAAFTEGVPSSSDYGISISEQLKARIDACNNMQTIAAKYEAVLSEYSALRFARNDLYDLWLAAEDMDLHAIYEANEKLAEAFNTVYDVLYPLATPKQQGEIDGYKSIMDNAQREIEESGYNEYIRQFYDTVLNRFPANILRYICKAKPPQYFE
jgi:hypothetical protein